MLVFCSHIICFNAEMTTLALPITLAVWNVGEFVDTSLSTDRKLASE